MQASSTGGFRSAGQEHSSVDLHGGHVAVGPVLSTARNRVGSDRAFSGWSQLLSLMPGLIGVNLRNAFFRFTMQECSADCHIGFGTIFSHADVSIGSGVYIGNYCSIGEVTIEKDVLIASHVSIMNG